jgi:hypothetical protein
LFKNKGCKNRNRIWKIKRKRETFLSPLAGSFPAHATVASPSRARDSLPPRPTSGPLRARAHAPLTRRPHSSVASPSPSLAIAPAGRLAPPVSHPVVLAAYGFAAVTSDHRPLPHLVPSPIPSPHRKVWHRPARRSGRVLARHRPAVRSCRRRCAALTPALCNLTGVLLALPLPSPRAPIKGPPRAPLSPAPASATHLPPHPSNRASAAVFFPSGKPFPLFSLPLWWFSEKLDRLISCATPP